ncbi:MAG: 16S rRNA (cytosine(967)-C(5))-methyltransferase RsmB [Clostridia bacterium]|nr:16S rRNA (cytosine(967)-C(5))-methyltransferase RsmB [Clostridia bacterium]
MTVREIALRMLDQYETEGKYVNLLLSSHIADPLNPKERAALTALLYTVVEHKLTYDYYVGSVAKRATADIDPHTLNILRLGACQIIDMESIPDFAAVNETVGLASGKGERSFVNAVLRRISALKASGELPMPDRRKNPARYLSVRYSFPLWMVKHFISLLGEDAAERLLRCYNENEYTDLTVNTLRISREELIERLRTSGVDAEASPLSPSTVRIDGACDVRRLEGFAEGLFFVQDTASALSQLALAPTPGDRIADLCSAPGGKSFLCAILSADEGEIYSMDIHESKLSLIRSGAERLGLSSIRVSEADARVRREELTGSLDRVICDCPCSGLGVLGKKSDMRYRSPEGMEELPELQLEILDAASAYPKEGGYILYSTCTLNPSENEEVVRRFLDTHPSFHPSDFLLGELRSEGGMLTLYPHIHQTDGFFIAKLVRGVGAEREED